MLGEVSYKVLGEVSYEVLCEVSCEVLCEVSCEVLSPPQHVTEHQSLPGISPRHFSLPNPLLSSPDR